MAKGDAHLAPAHFANKTKGALNFRGHGDVRDLTVRGFHEFLEFLERRRPDLLPVVRAARTVVGRDVGALEVNAGNGLPDARILQGGRNHGATVKHVPGRPGNERGNPVRDALGREKIVECAHIIGRDGIALQIDAVRAVDLNIE